MEETKGRTSDLSPSEPRRSSDRRNETESRSRDFDLSPSEPRRSSDRRNETESRSRAEKRVRFQDSDLSPSEPRRRSDRRHETESRSSWEENREPKESSLRISETGPIRDHLQEQRQSPRNFEIQRRRSHETESRSLEHKNRVDYPSAYSIRPSEEDCRDYRRRGLCSRGRSCRFNHPIHLRGACKYFLRGSCTNDSACKFYHPMDVAETMHQATSSDRRASESSGRFDERRGSSSRLEKRARDIPDSRERDPRGRFEDINRRRDGTVAEFKRARLEIPLQQQGDGNSDSQRREGQENVEEQRLMEIPLQQQGDGNSEPQIREGQENVEEQRLMEIEDQQIQEEEQPRDIARERMEHRMKLDQVKQTVKFGQSHRAEAELKELVFGRREGDGL